MNLIEQSYRRLFPDKAFFYQTKMEYNRRLGNFNANILKRNNQIAIHLNLQWKDIDDEIKIGLIQHLLLKVFKSKKNTSNIDLYNNFIRNIPLLTEKTKFDPLLEASFNRVNEQFFLGQMKQTNLEWGPQAFRKLASYNFHDDSITVSNIFRDAREDVLDYLMYHEMLHKYHKFKHQNGRSAFHTTEFRKAEKLYPNYESVEKEISQIIKSKRKSKRLWGLLG